MDVYGQLRKAQLENLSADPSVVSAGLMYFNTSTSSMKYYDGSIWRVPTAPDASGNTNTSGTGTFGALISGTIALSGLLSSTAAGNNTFGDTTHSAAVVITTATGQTALRMQPQTAATGAGAQVQGPYMFLACSAWSGSAAVSKAMAYTTYGVSGQNNQYYGAVESSDLSNIITYRGDAVHVAIGTTPQTETFYVNGSMHTTGTVQFDGANVANGSVASVLTANAGPTGAATSIQGWLKININGTNHYIPYW